MKNSQKIFMLIFAVWFAGTALGFEVGRDDGGEYCYRIHGENRGGMYPVGQESDWFDLHARSGSGDVDQDYTLIDAIAWQYVDMDFQAVRDMFPILKSEVNGHPLIYLDSGATAQMPQMVLDAIVAYYESYKANVGRGLYAFAERSTLEFENARAKVARFIGAKKQEIVFTSGATAGVNLVAHIWAQHNIHAGDEIVVSEVEHNANFIPWQQLAKHIGAVLKVVPLGEHGEIDAEILKNYVTYKTKLVAVTQQSNILGIVNDIAPIASVAHAVGAKLLVDAAQSVAHQRIDVEQMQCDFLVFSGHKLFGPTGIGVLFLKEGIFNECVLENFGGGMVLSVEREHTEFKCMPYCLEPGTQAIAQVIGLGAAIDFIWKHVNLQQVQEHETELVRYLASEIQKIPGLTIISPIPQDGVHSNLVTFTVDQCHAYDVAEYLNEHGIAVRAGYHCVQPYHDKLGGKSSVRVSITMYNTKQEIEFVVACLRKLLIVE